MKLIVDKKFIQIKTKAVFVFVKQYINVISLKRNAES